MSTSNQTHDHQQIKDWATERGGVPARVKGTGKSEGGVLRIHFPEHSNSNNELEEIGWDAFFEEFEDSDLDFLYQEKKASGEISTFHKFIERE